MRALALLLLALLAPRPSAAAGQTGMREAVGARRRACPALDQPKDVGFLVINLDRSPGRLARMRKAFEGESKKKGAVV